MPNTIKPIIRIHNAETDEIIDREMTDAEFSQYQAELETYQTKQAELENKAKTKSDLLERLGITAEEAALLLS